MNKLVKIASLTTLIVLLSGCNNLNNLNTPVNPKIDETIEIVNDSSIKSISDITSIAFEWQKVDDPRVIGYNFYRANLLSDTRNLKLVKSIKNRYATHYVDTNLEPNTKYIYQISSITQDGVESKTTNAYTAQTLPRIATLTFVQAISNLPNRIKIVWRPHEDRRVEYYKIEKFNTTLNDWVTLSTVKGRLQVEYLDTNLDNKESCKYRVTAYTFNDVASLPSEAVVATTKPLPLSPSNITASTNIAKQIEVKWEPSSTEDVIKYAIYRSPFESFGFSKEKEVSSDTLTYLDNINEDGKAYYYKIYSVDKDALQSTTKVDATKGITLKKPSKPMITLAQIQGNKAILNWTPGDNRATSYTVYKRIKLSFWEYKTVKITDIKALRFEDTDIISGVEYKYSIQANDEYGLISEKTDEASLILPQSKIIK